VHAAVRRNLQLVKSSDTQEPTPAGKGSAKYKVLFLGKLPPPYIGPAVACRILLQSRLREAFQLIHLDLSDPRDINTLAKIDFINIWLAVKQYFLLAWKIIRYRPDLVYIPAGQTTVGYVRDAGYILIAKLFRRKVVTHLRGGYFKNWYDECGPRLQAFVRYVHRKVDGQIVLGENLRPLFNWLLPDERIYVIPNGGDFPTPERKAGKEGITVLFLGNYIRTKGVLEALYAAPEVCRACPGTRFVFAGEWRDEATRKDFLAFMGKHPDLPVRNEGPVRGEHKFRLLAEADIFVFPTYYRNEGHPWVLVEAMAAGLPLVSTDHAAIPETVLDGRNGFLVEKRSPAAVAEKVIQLARDPGLRARMGEESRKLYLAAFTEDRMVDRMIAVFRQVITGHRNQK
jgi:glycosyltransferase involved in cell wall biosynthesis